MKMLRGQTLLITLLILTIAVTVALSLIGRSTTDVGMSGQIEQSSRAFSAAEAGIEDSLQTKADSAADIQTGVSFSTTVATIGATQSSYSFPNLTLLGLGETFWLTKVAADGAPSEVDADNYCSGGGTCTLDLCWVHATPKPAVEVSILYKASDETYRIARGAYDPDNAARSGNKFSAVDDAATGCGLSGVYKKIINIRTLVGAGSTPIFMRIRPYYNNATFTFLPEASRTLSPQGYEITSIGKTDSGVTRKIVVRQQYETPSSLFDYVLYSQISIIHN